MVFKARLGWFFSRREGGIAITTAIVLPLLLLAMAAVIDIGRMYAVRNKAQNAADAAILGAGASQNTVNFTDEFTNLFYANFPVGYLGSTVTQVNPSPTENRVEIIVEAPNILMNRIPGTMNLSNAGNTLIHITAGTNTPTSEVDVPSVEVALVVDNSGSMAQTATSGSSNSKMVALQNASKNLANILIGSQDTNSKVFISLIPYDYVVNIGPNHADWLQSTPANGPSGNIPPRPATYAGNSYSYFIPTKRTPRDKYLDTVNALNKGFVVGRTNVNGAAGPYLRVTDNTNARKVQPGRACLGPILCDKLPGCKILYGTDYTDPETGKVIKGGPFCPGPCQRCTIPGPQQPSAKPASFVQWDWASGKTANSSAYTNVSDVPPTGDDTTKFFTPAEVSKITAAKNDFTVPRYSEYTDASPSTYLPGEEDKFLDSKIGGPKFFSPNYTRPETRAWINKLAPVLFASSSKSEINTAVNAMQTSGDTRINIGLMWGWFTLSEKWKGLWDAGKPGLPATSSADAEVTKSLVLMTDGKNTVGTNCPGVSCKDTIESKQLCDAIKSAGITIYTVGFGQAGEIDETLLKYCASKPSYYFYAPSDHDLDMAFKQIGDSINQEKLRLTE